MAETSISYHSKDDYVVLYTTSKQKARSIKKRLEKRNAKWEYSEYQSGDGSYKFEVSKDDVRHFKKVIKGKKRDVDPTWLYEDEDKEKLEGEQS